MSEREGGESERGGGGRERGTEKRTERERSEIRRVIERRTKREEYINRKNVKIEKLDQRKASKWPSTMHGPNKMCDFAKSNSLHLELPSMSLVHNGAISKSESSLHVSSMPHSSQNSTLHCSNH